MAGLAEFDKPHGFRILLARMFTVDDDRWNELIKANPKLREFGYKPLQFEEELDTLFISNSATGENASVPTRGEPLPREDTSQEFCDPDNHSEFMESLNYCKSP